MFVCVFEDESKPTGCEFEPYKSTARSDICVALVPPRALILVLWGLWQNVSSARIKGKGKGKFHPRMSLERPEGE